MKAWINRFAIGAVLFCGFLWLCWVTFVRRLWQRSAVPAPVPALVA